MSSMANHELDSRSPTSLDLVESIITLVEQALRPGDLEEFGQQLQQHGGESQTLDKALHELMQELGSLGQASTSTATKKPSPPFQQQQHDPHPSTTVTGATTETLDTTHTFSLSSVKSHDEVDSGVVAIEKEAEAEPRESYSAGDEAIGVSMVKPTVPSASGRHDAEAKALDAATVKRPASPLHLKPAPWCGVTEYANTEPLDPGLGVQGNIVVVVLGASRVRVRVVSTAETDKHVGKSFLDDFPCCVEEPNTNELVKRASSFAVPTYSKSRKAGALVGGDAQHCCLDHPSADFRPKLPLTYPMQRGRKLSREDTEMLMSHAFGLVNQDSVCTPTLLTYKPTATADEVLEMVSVLLETLQMPLIRMANAAEVAALALDLSTGILVDIRESGISVTPILDGCSVASGARWEAFGVADATKFTDTMPHTREKEYANQMPCSRNDKGVSKELPEVVVDALASVDTGTMAVILGDVAVVGDSTATFDGFEVRLQNELKKILPNELANRVNVRVPSTDGLQQRDPLSRCSPSAVMIGAERLLEEEGLNGDHWITRATWYK